MEADFKCVFILLFLVNNVMTQDASQHHDCSYMSLIPRPDRPEEWPTFDFTNIPWNSRPLIPGPDRQDVCMDVYETPAQVVYMEEEIDGEVPIAILNYYNTTVLTPETSPFIRLPLLNGQAVNLGPEIRYEDGRWILYITNRQDYETPAMRRYFFEIVVPEETLVAMISLGIVNIDDNPPAIYAFDPCQQKENSATGLTECLYEVHDADGEISTRQMTFRINSDRGDEDVFYIDRQYIVDEWYVMHMVLGLNSPLDYETNPLHIFGVTAFDSAFNNHTATVMVQVENVESRDPRWLEIFAVQQFLEKTATNFTIRAIDGDTGINRAIDYRIITEEGEGNLFSISTNEGGRSGALFQVSPINRDELEREVFRVTIIAFKTDDNGIEYANMASVVIIVDDINDQRPVPFQDSYILRIPEETLMTLRFETDLGFHDKDLGENAQYSLELVAVHPIGAENCFYIAPTVGYQRQTFIMGTVNHNTLDFEDEDYQFIELQVIATDMNLTSMVGVATLFIELENWNDEEPIFEQDFYEANFNETEGEDFYVATVRAHDIDIGDRVVHSLMGNAEEYFRIDPELGHIYVLKNDSFDFHRQNIYYIQVRAVDTLMAPYHTATVNLEIQLNDINNTPPTLRLPRGSPHLEENVPEGFEITTEIEATDPDTTADLVFEIDWESSYATKQGRETDPREYHNCVEIETIFPNENNRGIARGRVTVKEIRPNVTIDFEEFEVLYLTVIVRDQATLFGDPTDELTFTIIIVDMNDNWPIYAEGSLETSFRVREMADSGTVIGSVLATDIDGPLYNRVRYRIVPRENTPDTNLVTIDEVTGQINVDRARVIDADVPKRENLYYTVIANDNCTLGPEECNDPTFWDIEGNITIYIQDTNNKVPVAEVTQYRTVVEIYENATSGDYIETLVSSDLDRDEIYHTVRYQINYAFNMRLAAFFAVDFDTGDLVVNYTTDAVLDRDRGEPNHTVRLTFTDNFYFEGDGTRNSIETEVLVVLLDVNDNAPELPLPSELSWNISESLTEGIRLQPDIYAPDIDEPDTDNSRVGYRILDLSITDRIMDIPELFEMIQIENVTGELETKMDLKSYWGTYNIHIEAYDHGIPQQKSDEIYRLVIFPYNFYPPVFTYPLSGSIIRLSQERALANGRLVTVSGDFMDYITATDEDGLHAGTVTFNIAGNAEASEYFTVANDGENIATLMLTRLFTETIREFQVTIRATDGGTDPGPLSTDSQVRVIFVPTQGTPIFQTSQHAVRFFELEQGMDERFQIPLATDPKNHECSDDCYDIFYGITSGNEEGFFALDPVTNNLYLTRQLNRAENEVYTLTVSAGNDIPSVTPPIAASAITVVVNVREADPRPRFARDLYTAGISTLDSINRELLTVHATHSENSVINYMIDQNSMAVDPSLESVKESAFILNSLTGVLTLNMQPNAFMHGLFEFEVVATDEADASDRSEVKVFMVSSMNRVYFRFINTVEEVETSRDFVAQTFSTAFNMTCNIDQIIPATDSSGVALSTETEVRAHFIRNLVAVPAEEIEAVRSDPQLLASIQLALYTRQLLLADVATDLSPETQTNNDKNIIYVLIGLLGIFGILLLTLFFTYIFNTRSLKRRIEALSLTKYGSVDSGLNKAGIAAPGTNKHALEGSNPIWNESTNAPDFDALSDITDDSDLIGIEDMPQFRDGYFRPEDSHIGQTTAQNPFARPIASHTNNFGFSTNPHSSQFRKDNFNFN